MPTSSPADVAAALAPAGALRAAINLGNAVLARAGATDGVPQGVSVDLARDIAAALGRRLELVVVDTAAKSVEAVESGAADVGFFAVDPRRADRIAFTAPYLLIEGVFVVPQASPIRSLGDVDRDGVRVAVGAGSAYDLHLSRELARATIVRAPSTPAVFPHYVAERLEVAAGIRAQLAEAIAAAPGHRMIEPAFMAIRQAVATRRDRGDAAVSWLATFVETAKADGRVAAAIARHGVTGAALAPPDGAPSATA